MTRNAETRSLFMLTNVVVVFSVILCCQFEESGCNCDRDSTCLQLLYKSEERRDDSLRRQLDQNSAASRSDSRLKRLLLRL